MIEATFSSHDEQEANIAMDVLRRSPSSFFVSLATVLSDPFTIHQIGALWSIYHSSKVRPPSANVT